MSSRLLLNSLLEAWKRIFDLLHHKDIQCFCRNYRFCRSFNDQCIFRDFSRTNLSEVIHYSSRM